MQNLKAVSVILVQPRKGRLRVSEVLLVDTHDRPLGTMEKLEAHEKGLLHRAFSLFVVSDEAMLIQRRATAKYHSGGLWANACCSHPGRNADVVDEAIRRAREELGLDPAQLEDRPVEVASFVYRADLGSVFEYEYDHVLLARAPQTVQLTPDPEEVDRVAWVGFDELERRLLEEPDDFAPWFLTACPLVLAATR